MFQGQDIPIRAIEILGLVLERPHFMTGLFHNEQKDERKMNSPGFRPSERENEPITKEMLRIQLASKMLK